MQQDKLLIVTADDFGIAPEINTGIVAAHRDGIVTSASLLMNAPATEQAIKLGRENPNLELGIHLSVVEGLSLANTPSTVTDKSSYFGGKLCLIRHWKPFLARYACGALNLTDIKRELELQIQEFLKYFDDIPFANATQHLHLLPGVREIVLDLVIKYRIRCLRILHNSRMVYPWGRRLAYNIALCALGKRQLKLTRQHRIITTDHFAGFDIAGRLAHTNLSRFIALLRPGTTELMTHPGRECAMLRRELPWGYRDYQWEQELRALTSPLIRDGVAELGIKLVRFGNIAA